MKVKTKTILLSKCEANKNILKFSFFDDLREAIVRRGYSLWDRRRLIAFVYGDYVFVSYRISHFEFSQFPGVGFLIPLNHFNFTKDEVLINHVGWELYRGDLYFYTDGLMARLGEKYKDLKAEYIRQCEQGVNQ